MYNVFNENSDYLKKALDAANLRMEVISNNIANINTPGYTAKAVAFEDKLKELLAQESQESDDGFQAVSMNQPGSSAKQNLSSLNPEIYDEDQAPDINQQMTNLAKAQIVYAALSKSVGKEFSYIKSVMDGFQR